MTTVMNDASERAIQLPLSGERTACRCLSGVGGWCFTERKVGPRLTLLQWLTIAIVASQLAACSLTQDQLSAVKGFASATQGYSSKASALVTADANVFLARESFEAAPIENPDQLWKKANNVRGDYEREIDLAAKLTTAMAPLSIYSQELQQFATKDFTSQNDAAAKNLGDNFNKAVDSANKMFGTTLPAQSIGTAVSYSVQYLGDIYIKYQQAEETKLVVEQSDPTVKELTARVKVLAEDIQKNSLEPTNEQFRKSLLKLSSAESLEFNWRPSDDRESSRRQKAVGKQTSTPHILTPSDSMALFQALLKLDDAQNAAKSLIEASDACAAAHEKMLQALNKPETSSDALTQIEIFAAKAKASTDDSTK